MSLPSPDQLQAFLDDIAHQARQLGPEFRWLHPNAHRRPKRGSGERRGGDGYDVADEVAVTAGYRGRLEWAARNVVDARNRLLTAQAALNDAVAMIEPAPSVEQLESSLPHPADRGDYARAKAAQERRKARAERTGDWAEVTGG